MGFRKFLDISNAIFVISLCNCYEKDYYLRKVVKLKKSIEPYEKS